MNVKSFACIGILSLICYGCKPSDPQPVSSTPKVVTVGRLGMISSITHYVAVSKGFYAEQGLDVRDNELPSSNVIAQQLVDGKIDAAIELSVVPLLKSVEQTAGKPAFEIFSTSRIVPGSSFDGIVVKPNSSIKTFDGLTNKKVGVFPGSTAKNTLISVFHLAYPNVQPPKAIPIDPKLQLTAFGSDDIDALYAYEPTLSLAISKFNGRLIPGSGLYARQVSPNPIGVAAVNKQFLKANPDTAKRLIAALNKAAKFIETNPDEAKQCLKAQEQKVSRNYPEEAIKRMNDLHMCSSEDTSFVSLQDYERVLIQMGELKKSVLAKDMLYSGK